MARRISGNGFTIAASLLFAGVLSGQQPQEVPALLRDGRLTVHAHLPENYHPGISIRQQLVDVKSQAPSRGVRNWSGLEFIVSDEVQGSPTVLLIPLPLQLYAKYSCSADAIVIGRARSSSYHLSASETSIYGDHLFSIDILLKDHAASPLHPGTEIVVTRPGGSLVLPEGPVKMDLRAYPPFDGEATYLLFLRFIEASSAYSAIDPFSTLRLDPNHGWIIARSAFAGLRLPELARGTFETRIAEWRQTCK